MTEVTSPELIEAGKRVYSDVRLGHPISVSDAIVCAEYILATVREDDDELVTMAWIEAFSLNEIRIGLTQIHYLPYGIAYHGKTKSQFRQLCRGLGIELKEDDQ